MNASWLGLALFFSVLFGCSTSPTGRKQLDFLPAGYVDKQGVQAFSEIKSQTPVDTREEDKKFVTCVAEPLVNLVKAPTGIQNWEIVVFNKNEINAFALPGGKIGVYTGIFKAAKNDAQLATVLAHEVGHVLSKHSAERMSEGLAQQGTLLALDQVVPGGPEHAKLMGLLGVGAQVGVALPFSRTQEAEADLVGLDLMARAGFDPEQSVELWKNMTVQGGKGPSEFLSDHPSNPNRIKALQDHMADAVQKYNQAQASGQRPHCSRAR